MCVAMLPGRQHALVHQLHLAHVVVRVGHEAEAVMNKQQETWVETGIIVRAEGRQSNYLAKLPCLLPPSVIGAYLHDQHVMTIIGLT